MREEVIKARRIVSVNSRAEASHKITQQLFDHPLFISARKIFSYISRDDEVSTEQLLKTATRTKSIFVPAIKDDHMFAIPYTDREKMIQGPYGIMVPQGNFTPYKEDDYDLIIVPGVAFDIYGNRLGMGKGFFDRFLKTVTAPTIGLAFDCQVVDKVPIDDYDVPVSFLVTPNTFLSCGLTTMQR